MNSINILAVTLVAVIALFTSSAMADIDGGLVSTAKIAAKLCLGNHNDTVAADFFSCYDVAPGKDLFVKCQNKVFKALMDTEKNISNICLFKLIFFPSYASCLKSEFAAANLDLSATTDLVNVCEAKVLGIN